MSPLLSAALDEVRLLAASRPWSLPSATAIEEAQRLLDLVTVEWPAPEVLAEPDGSISLEWEAGDHGWLALAVDGSGTVTHSAVIEGDEYGQTETFEADRLPDWAGELLRRLHP
ncbi:hypothetical protein [Eleftheria terrae]|uniref:hypothetical protein n=1 Tax=Eleftheria terrae TaxID=1597781 RepID=UPI00263A59A7|nr:hypothetical protein [Eleftheria terrae]WKB51862.1 hypothetical protein N7L95_18945 [Eleftheria terrae]